jgi:hypothetical protein
MADITPARKLFDLLVSRDFDPNMLDITGKPAADPSEAEIFSFDFRGRSGQDYGTVVIMLGDQGSFEVYCSDNVGRSMEGHDKDDWFNFLEQLKNFAVRNHYNDFGIRNLNHLKYSMQGQAAIKEGLFESWTGTRNVSWNGEPTEARLMIRHKRNIGEGEARYRHIDKLFIETAEGERYKLQFNSLTAGRAMLEHVRQGGRPYDARGMHITEMVSELAVLSRFKRANTGHIFEGDTAQLVEQAAEYQTALHRNLKSLGTSSGYASYFESWNPATITEEEVVIESLKNLFVKQTLDTRIESALPLLAKIQQQGTAMKEANIFENWVNNLVEGTWQLPDTPEKQAKLVELLQQELPVGADATNATEQLYDLIGDDHLFDQLEELADLDANADARQVIIDRLQEMSSHPDVRQVLDQVQIDADVEMNPPEATPADLGSDEMDDADHVPGAGGMTNRLAETLGYSTDPEQAKWYHEGRNAHKNGTTSQSGLIQDIARKHGCPPEWLDAFRAGYQDQEGFGKDSVDEDAELSRMLEHAGVPIQEGVLTDSTGSTLEHIKDTYKRDVKDFVQNGELSDDLYHALYDYYFDDMPYGTKKARTGDPYEWIGDRFAQDLGLHRQVQLPFSGEDYMEEEYKDPHTQQSDSAGTPQPAYPEYEDPLSQILKTAGVGTEPRPAPDYQASELDEGPMGAVAGEILAPELGPLAPVIGSAVGDAVSPDKETDEDHSPLAGKYGHSGRMKEVGKDTSFLDRLKELSGMKK